MKTISQLLPKTEDMQNKHSQLIATTRNFTNREIKTRYAGSLFGSLWIVLYPLAFAIISVLIFSLVFRERIGDTPYFLFVLVGFTCWFWFSQTVVYATRSLIHNRELIINNKFPTESIIFSIAGARIIDYAINILIIFLVMVFFRQVISLQGVLLLLTISVTQLLFQTGIALLSSVINIHFRDWQNIMDILLQLGFYATPIVYALDIVPTQFRTVIQMNPMTQFILAYRGALFHHAVSAHTLILLGVLGIATFIIGYIVYKKYEHAFAELI